MIPTKTFIHIITSLKKQWSPNHNLIDDLMVFSFLYISETFATTHRCLIYQTYPYWGRDKVKIWTIFGREWIIQVWGSLDNVLSVMKNNLSAGAVKTYSNQTHMKHIFGLYMYREYLSPSYLINVSFLITYFSDQVIPKRYILVFFLLMVDNDF